MFVKLSQLQECSEPRDDLHENGAGSHRDEENSEASGSLKVSAELKWKLMVMKRRVVFIEELTLATDANLRAEVSSSITHGPKRINIYRVLQNDILKTLKL